MTGDTSLIEKLAKQWQTSLNNLPSNNYIGNRDNQYISVNNSQNTSIIRAGLQFSDFKGQVPLDMPGIIAHKQKDLLRSSIDKVWHDIHHNNETVMRENKRLSFIELWPCNNSDVHVTYSIKHPIVHYSDVIGYIGKSINIRSTKLQNIFSHAQSNQQLSWKNHTIIHQERHIPLQENQARAIGYFLTGNKKLLTESASQAKIHIDNLKMVIQTTCSIQFIQTLLSGSLLKNMLEILQNENL
jgi:hypothetical protein